MPRRIALVTCEKFPLLYEDDHLLRAALTERGVEGVPVVWSDPPPDWSLFDLALIRSTWDYHRRYPEFQRWIDATAARVSLWNPPGLLRWNTHKSYLRELAAHGVPIVPTEWARSPAELAGAADRRGWRRTVVKPTVSASAERTFLLGPGERIEALPLDDLGMDGWMVQPYLDEVEDRGERSLVFVDGDFSHAAQRKAALNPTASLVDGSPVEATPAERATARVALASVPGPWLYARVDVVTTRDGVARLMELEMVEPLLYLRTAPTAAAKLASALERKLR